MADIARFRFEPPTSPPESTRVAIVEGVRSKADLLRSLSSQLSFPDWFGWNWDALHDCLRDLSWLQESRIVLQHGDVPALPIDELRAYLDILSDVTRDSASGNQRELRVTFRPEARAILLAVLEGA